MRHRAAEAVPIYYSLIYGFAMFLAWNIVSIPIGIIEGFREARGQSFGRRGKVVLEVLNIAAELAVLIAITLRLIHASEGSPLGVVALAYGLLIAFEFVALKALKRSTRNVWLHSLAVMLTAASISILAG